MEEAGVIDRRFRLCRTCRQFSPQREPVLIFEVRRHRISTVEVPYRARASTIEIVRVYHSSRHWPQRL
jgi:plasmid stabilization system protein ParE